VKIGNLFLVRDKGEYAQAQDIIRRAGLEDCTVLPIQDTFPFWGVSCDWFGGADSWEDYGIRDLELGGYWLHEYKEIEELVTAELGKRKLFNRKMALSPHFTFGMVEACSREYYDPIDALHCFFTECSPQKVYFNPSASFISRLITAILSLHKIELKPLKS
jgi:hypothetical protein